jgi:hypothetical protein
MEPLYIVLVVNKLSSNLIERLYSSSERMFTIPITLDLLIPNYVRINGVWGRTYTVEN